MNTIYCAKLENNGSIMAVDFLESEIRCEKPRKCLDGNSNEATTIEIKEKNAFRQNKLKWMFNTAMFGFSSALIEVEIDDKIDFDMQTLEKAVTQYFDSMGLKNITINFISASPIDFDRLIAIINEYNQYMVKRAHSDSISISYNVELTSPTKVRFSDLAFENLKQSLISMDINDCPDEKEFEKFIDQNVLKVFFDVSRVPFYSEEVQNLLLRLLRRNFKNVHVIPVNKQNIPFGIYKEAINMFYEDNGIQKNEKSPASVNLFESVCHSVLPNEFIIDASGNIRKCKHNNDNNTIIGTIIHGNFDIDFSKYLKWIIPNDRLLQKNNCSSCFYYPCCQGVACKFYELTNNDLLCPQKFNWLKEHLVTEFVDECDSSIIRI